MAEKLSAQEIDAIITQYGLQDHRYKNLSYKREGEVVTATLEDAIAVCGLHMFQAFQPPPAADQTHRLSDEAVGNIFKSMVDASQ